MPRRTDVLSETRFWESLLKQWHNEGRFKDVQPCIRTGVSPSRPCLRLLRGDGVLCGRGEFAPGTQHRRYTATALINFEPHRPVCLEVSRGSQVYYVCPKYDLADYDADRLKAFHSIMVARGVHSASHESPPAKGSPTF